MAKISVTNGAQLNAALQRASAGDIIQLAGGSYGTLAMDGARQPHMKFGSTVTLVSADPSRPAVFEKLALQSVANVAFDGIDFKFNPAIEWSPFRISGSTGIDIRNAKFDGTPASGYGIGTGLLVRNTKDMTLENSEFVGFLKGMEFHGMEDLRVLNNNVHDFTGDGLTFAQLRGGLIAGNHIHDVNGNPASDFHQDGIQIWTTNTQLSTANVTIRGNLIDTGDGRTQGIFMGNEVGTSRPYKNIVIEDNAVIGGHINGITMGYVQGATVRDNVVLMDSTLGLSGKIHMPQINMSKIAVDASIYGNVVHSVNTNGNITTKVFDNKIVGVGTKLSDIWPGWEPGAVDETPSMPAPVPPATPVPPSAPAPAPAPDGDADGPGEVPVAALVVPQSRAFYVDLAGKLSLTLKDGQGDAGNNLVLAKSGHITSGGGDDLLIGSTGNNWITTGPGDDIVAGLAGVDTIRFNGQHVQGRSTDVVLDLNFSQGDKIELTGYQQRTFPNAGNQSALIDSLDDFAKIAAGSQAVAVATDNDTLVLSIAQSGGTQTIRFLGLGDDFDLL